MTTSAEKLGEIFPACRQILEPEIWQTITGSLPDNFDQADFPVTLAALCEKSNLPPWLPDLARVESARRFAASHRDMLDTVPAELCHNPTLSIIASPWTGLPELIGHQGLSVNEPAPGQDIILAWLKQPNPDPIVRSATAEELLALKIVIEGLDKQEIARSGQVSLAELDRALDLAVARGVLLKPPSALRRNPAIFSSNPHVPEEFMATGTFTLQWHITQACDLHCKHCYDRSSRSSLTLDDAVIVLDQVYDFCQARHVHGQITFTGGNPLLHPQFLEIYRAAADRGLMNAIAGNPTDPETLAGICGIRKPEFYQVSLEGLEEHNDFIRGDGHFQGALKFLDHLREAGIYSMVMLTLTRDNLDQVLPLAEQLRDRADLFTFNRLSMVGEGATLMTPAREEYEVFLNKYLAAEPDNPVMALKDNLINIIRYRQGQELFGGCAGFGCGAAFNFVALLPDGEVHACRKFPSPMGNIHQQNLADIYDSDDARRYRRGPEECRGCEIRHVCGGRLAVIDSKGLEQLLWARDYCNENTRELRLAGLDENCLRILEITRLANEFAHYAELSEAVKSFA